MRIFLEIEIRGERNESQTQTRIREIIERELSREFATPVDVEFSSDPGEEYNRGYDQGRNAEYDLQTVLADYRSC